MPLLLPPDMPSWLPPVAKRRWRELVPELDRAGLLSRLDQSVLVVHVLAWARFRQASEAVAELGVVIPGTKGPRKHPALQVVREAEATLIRSGRELGLSPAARQGLDVAIVDDDDADDILD
jgi:P27 family predicted phage terminase small subunit